MSDPITFKETFQLLLEHRLSQDVVRKTFDAILRGAWNEAQVAGLLTALRVQGESATTITAAAEAMRAVMVPVTLSPPQSRILDTCGTGGDGQNTVNLSTAAAIICAAAGETVAKHGNRAVSSQAGSADVLAALGVPSDLPPGAAARLLEQVGIAFMLAPTHHPAMRFAAPVRNALKIRTLFNCLGPLANPAGATHQLIGAFADDLRGVLADALKSLGTTRAWIVRGEDGMDELSPYAPTRVTELSEGCIAEFTLSPEDFGLTLSPAGAAHGGDADHNAQVIRQVFAGQAHSAKDAIVLNAAGALVVARGLAYRDAAKLAAQILADGRAAAKLEAWSAAANHAKAELAPRVG
jgi:anthranilate phosphoribosyltransferase